MASLFGAFPFLVKLYADGGYQGPEFQRAMKRILARVDLEIVKRLGHARRLRRSSPSAGSSNAPSPGLAAAANSPRIGNASTARRWPSTPPRLHPPHAAKAMQSCMMFPDKTLQERRIFDQIKYKVER